MRLVAETIADYQCIALLQKQITQLFKAEKGTGTKLEESYKAFINTSIEKTYEMPGQSLKAVNTNATMDSDDPAVFIAYIVHAAISRKKLAIEYMDAKGNVSKRIIEPHSWRNNQVVGWCHERGAWRQFKPSQIKRVAVLDEAFDRDEEVLIVASDATEMAHLIPTT